ncbi:hypothetical protein Pint_29750 [Pistacia integerrima]|uniref:Uncharacterized protein n=1 Tax=Pistacia integerrima TaxID=434235 RepID=A0ACC0X0U0_9ROSI|nr:hypothetical protein Pint_29750 [Pistacia integerrima]
MHKFRLFISVLDVEELVPYIDKWIGLAAEKEVKELDLDILIESDTMDTPYTLPQTIFSARSVTILRLVNCKLENISVGCLQLKKLFFGGVSLMDQQFHYFISSFPLLEDLILEYCHFLERITISSNQLKKFGLSSCLSMEALDLDTPNLLSFTYNDSPIPTSRINALCLWQVKFDTDFTFDTQLCLKLREFLGVSNQIKDLKIDATPTVVCV